MDVNNEKLDFNYAIEKLEEIVAKLENGSETLEESLKLYETGVGLCNECMANLEKAKLKVEYLNCEEKEE